MLRKYDGPHPSSSKSSSNKASASTSRTTQQKSGNKKGRAKMTVSELAQAKLSSPSLICHMLGHWGDAHSPDGSLKPGTPSFDPSSRRLPCRLAMAVHRLLLIAKHRLCRPLTEKPTGLSPSHGLHSHVTNSKQWYRPDFKYYLSAVFAR